jgi:spore coat protein U-like protein
MTAVLSFSVYCASALPVSGYGALPSALRRPADTNTNGCTFGTITTIAFAPYDPIAGSDDVGVGSIGYACDAGTNESVTIGLSNGMHSSGNSDRNMSKGSDMLPYQIYLDSGHQTVWGDDSFGSEYSATGATSTNVTMFGRIPRHVNAPVGQYSDMITVTFTAS